MCHVSCVTCHLSHVKLFFSNFFYPLKKLDKVVELVGGGSVISRAYPSSFQKYNGDFVISFVNFANRMALM